MLMTTGTVLKVYVLYERIKGRTDGLLTLRALYFFLFHPFWDILCWLHCYKYSSCCYSQPAIVGSYSYESVQKGNRI